MTMNDDDDDERNRNFIAFVLGIDIEIWISGSNIINMDMMGVTINGCVAILWHTKNNNKKKRNETSEALNAAGIFI